MFGYEFDIFLKTSQWQQNWIIKNIQNCQKHKNTSYIFIKVVNNHQHLENHSLVYMNIGKKLKFQGKM